MPHLTLEEIARLVDEPPEPAEALHLAACAACRTEMEAMRAQTESLAQLPDPEPSPRAWVALEAALVEEGLLRRRAPVPQSRAVLRLAASLALVVLGGGGGFAAWQAWSGSPGGGAALPPALATREAPDRPRPVPVEIPAEPSPESAPEPVRTAAGEPRVRLASHSPEERRGRAESAPAEVNAAVRELRSTREEYLRGLAQYAELAGAADADPLARLAVLDALVSTTREALQRAPDDPAINGYYLAAVGQRDAMIRQLAVNTQETWY